MHTPARKSAVSSQTDLWLVVREGSLAEVELALAQLKKNGGNINSRNTFGVTPLHAAVWRNNIPVVRRILEAGADPDARDGESGWSSLHRSLHFGHLAVASLLLQSGASVTLEDSKSRTPVDLLSGPVSQVLGDGDCSEVFSWGSGVNYQLGTGNAHMQKLPCKVDSLHGSFIKLISAAKFHSVAVSARGEVYTWGFGRGGRLGHPDFDIHSGQAAVITPRQVTYGLGSRRVVAVAAAKHHTVVATEGGDVFTWGSNREGQLGYTSVDTQPTPRRVSSLKPKIVAVAAANKHTAVVSDCGEVYTWGCNKEGQLGYGTSNSASNYTPRVVEYLKGKNFTAVAAAKYHTIALGTDGEVYTWGHRLVTPRRVVIARNIKKSGSTPLKFHRWERLHVVSVAAGVIHSSALTDDGALFYWVSSDPHLRCQQFYTMCGRNLVSISSGKYWTAAVTSTGDIYMWDGKKGEDKLPVATRLHGTKRATSVSVGETHLLIVGSLYHPIYLPNEAKKVKASVINETEATEDDSIYNDVEPMNSSFHQECDSGQRPVPSLKSLCEKVAAQCLVEPRNAVQLLEISDSLGADELTKLCEDIVIRNLDYIFTVSAHAIANASLDILAKLEQLLDVRSSELWSSRRLPTPTATFPAIINSEEDDSESEFSRARNNQLRKSTMALNNGDGQKLGSFLNPMDGPSQGISKQVRALRKKLQQIEMLEVKQSSGLPLDDQQIAKLHTRSAIEKSLAELGVPVETTLEKCSEKDGKSKKQRRKSKQRAALVGVASSVMDRTDVKSILPNEVLDIETSQLTKIKGENFLVERSATEQEKCESPLCVLKKNTSDGKGESPLCPTDGGTSDSSSSKRSSPATAKKKNRKGGLSMFLSGALDDIPKVVAPPPATTKVEGPAWGGLKIVKASTSLRVIQDEQSKTKEIHPSRSKEQAEESLHARSSGKIQLSSFLPSSPVPVVSACSSQTFDGERNTPPWAASGTPPLLSRPSLRDIQMQQGKQQQSLSSSPKTRTTGFLVATGQGSPSDTSGVNRWFKPEVDAPSSIRSIQIEEKAMKEFKRYYSSVKIVKNHS